MGLAGRALAGALCSIAIATMPALGQTVSASEPLQAAARAEALGPCSIINARAELASALPLLFATCGKTGVIVGEARSYATAWNAVLGSLLVVGERDYHTTVWLVAVGDDGGARVEDLTPGLEKRLGEAGRIRSAWLAVDLAAFKTAGAIVVTPKLMPAITVKAGTRPLVTTALSVNVTAEATRARAAIVATPSVETAAPGKPE